jgi:glycine/D-amino acid oxidase-like deaminating enzyme
MPCRLGRGRRRCRGCPVPGWASTASEEPATAFFSLAIEHLRQRTKEAELEEVVRRVRDSIGQSGVTAAQFALLVGTSASHMSTYANGRVTPSATMLLRIKRAGARRPVNPKPLEKSRDTGWTHLTSLVTPDKDALIQEPAESVTVAVANRDPSTNAPAGRPRPSTTAAAMPGARDNSTPSYMVVRIPDDGSFFATGFSGHGFGLGPGAGHTLAELIATGRAPLDIRKMRYERFAERDLSTARKIL